MVHKGRNARLSMYGLTPIRPTKADLDLKDASGLNENDIVEKNGNNNKDKS